MRKNLCLILICVMVLSSCTITQNTSVTAPVTNLEVKQYPTVADLEVNPQKVSKTEEWDFVPFNIGQPSMKIRKNNMVADILKDNNADVLLEPQTVFVKQPFGKRTLTITGFSAKFSNFRKATDEDLKALEVVGTPSATNKIYNVNKKNVIKEVDGLENSSSSGSGSLRKKMEWKINVGATFSTLRGNDKESYTYSSKPGYDIEIGFRRTIKNNIFWGMSTGFLSRGFQADFKGSRIDDTENMMCHVFNFMPVKFGYKYDITEKLAVSAFLGAYLDIVMVQNFDQNYTGSRRDDEQYSYSDDLADFGFRFGLGAQYGHIALDFSIDRGVIGRMCDLKQRSIGLNLGFIF